MKGELQVTNSSGHATIEYDTEVKNGPLDPAVAEREFNRLVEGGWLGYGTTVEGVHEATRTFKPEVYVKHTVTPIPSGG